MKPFSPSPDPLSLLSLESASTILINHWPVSSSIDSNLDFCDNLWPSGSPCLSCPVTILHILVLHFFLFFKKIIFNWRIIAFSVVLVSDIHQHESAIGLYMSSPSWTSLLTPPFPLLLGCHRALFEFPESHSKFPLAIYFTHGSVYVSMLLSPFIPPTHNSSKNKVLIWKSMFQCFSSPQLLAGKFSSLSGQYSRHSVL